MKPKALTPSIHFLAAVALLLLLPALLFAQEGYDPMRVISAQQPNPVMMLTLDNSGSMAFPVNTAQGGEGGGVDWAIDGYDNYYYIWKYRFVTPSGTFSGSARIYADDTIAVSTGTSPAAGQGIWMRVAKNACPAAANFPCGETDTGGEKDCRNTYSIWYFVPPSRMAIMKNTLGSTLGYWIPKAVTAMPGYNAALSRVDDLGTGPKFAYAFCNSGCTCPADNSCSACVTYGGPTGGKYWDATAAVPGWVNAASNPDANYTSWVPAKMVVENNAQFANWGLMYYNTTSSSSCSYPVDRLATWVVAPASYDEDNYKLPVTDPDNPVYEIRRRLGPVMQSGSQVGLRPYGGTPTRKALETAQDTLQETLTSDDESCIRTYGVILVTDGESNCGNGSPEGYNHWGSNCPDAAGDCPACPTSCPSCETAVQYFPPDTADDLWTVGITKASKTYNLRTYVIGFSSNVSKCELNWTAYYGRTDAYYPDVGFNTDGDPRLPDHAYDFGGVNASPSHAYSFFADGVNAAAEIRNAFLKIISTMGAGDYTTSPPVVITSLDDGKPYALLGSSEFSSLRGHLYAYDVSQPQSPVFKWDAGWRLSKTTFENEVTDNSTNFNNYSAADVRKIYTWVPSTGALVEITSANAAQLDTIAGFTSANPVYAKTAAVGATNMYPLIDFVRGKYWDSATASYKERGWKLGPILNVTPAVIGAAEVWEDREAALPDHGSFQTDYANRHSLIYVGASDGMIHAFDLSEGYEVFALMAPNNLANQAALYYNFITGSGTDTGEPGPTVDHIYGASNSVRFTDVPFCTGTGSNRVCTYKTLLFITEGLGGNQNMTADASDPSRSKAAAPSVIGWPCWLANVSTDATCPGAGWGTWAWPTSSAPRSAMYTVDVTHPYPPDARFTDNKRTYVGLSATYRWPMDYNFDTSAMGNNIAPKGFVDSSMGVFQTWSVPAVGCHKSETWACVFGSGFNPLSKVLPAPVNQVSPTGRSYDPASYAAGVMGGAASSVLTYAATGVVGDQAFANSVAWRNNESYYNPGHAVNEGLYADLNGKLYTVAMGNSIGSAAGLASVGAGNPIYYSPAAGFYDRDSSHQYRLYAFGTGSFYERSANVIGSSACSSGGFCARIYVLAYDVNNEPSVPVTPSNTTAMWSSRLTDLELAEPNANGETTLSDQAQLTASPVLFLPPSGSEDNPFAIFLIYDKGSGTCAGDSYVFLIEFQPGDPTGMAGAAPAGDGAGMFHASQGVAGGFATVAGSVIVSISGIGQGQRATVVKVPNIQIGSPGGSETPVWWMELK